MRLASGSVARVSAEHSAELRRTTSAAQPAEGRRRHFWRRTEKRLVSENGGTLCINPHKHVQWSSNCSIPQLLMYGTFFHCIDYQCFALEHQSCATKLCRLCVDCFHERAWDWMARLDTIALWGRLHRDCVFIDRRPPQSNQAIPVENAQAQGYNHYVTCM